MAAGAPAVTTGAVGSTRDWSETAAALRPGGLLDDRAVELRVPARPPEPVGGVNDRPTCLPCLPAVGRSRKEAAVTVAAPGGELAMAPKRCTLRFSKCPPTQPEVPPDQRHATKSGASVAKETQRWRGRWQTDSDSNDGGPTAAGSGGSAKSDSKRSDDDNGSWDPWGWVKAQPPAQAHTERLAR